MTPEGAVHEEACGLSREPERARGSCSRPRRWSLRGRAPTRLSSGCRGLRYHRAGLGLHA